MIDQKMPNAIELEAVVLGAILQESGLGDEIFPLLPPLAFYDDKHEIIYRAILEMSKDTGKKVDSLTLGQFLNSKKLLDQAGGFQYLSQISQGYVTEEHVIFHAHLIRDRYLQRLIINGCSGTMQRAFDGFEVADAYDNLRKLIDEVDGILSNNSKDDSFGSIVERSITRAQTREEIVKKGGHLGIPTGLTDLNKQIGGWQPQKVYIVGARPSMGKTALMLHFAKSAAKALEPPAVFSLETDDLSLVDRVIIGESGVKAQNFRMGLMDEMEWRQVRDAQIRIKDLHIHIDDTSSVTVSRIRAKCRHLQKKGKLKVLFLDYVQLMEGEEGNNREQQLSKISRGLKRLARDLNIPVVLLAQLSRKVEDKEGKKPGMSDIRECGSLEQDADVIMFPWRPSYYKKDAMDGNESWKNKGALVIVKNKEGATGDVKFTHNSNLTQFYDYVPEGSNIITSSEQTDLPF
jgi:replicative DNA helicase